MEQLRKYVGFYPEGESPQKFLTEADKTEMGLSCKGTSAVGFKEFGERKNPPQRNASRSHILEEGGSLSDLDLTISCSR